MTIVSIFFLHNRNLKEYLSFDTKLGVAMGFIIPVLVVRSQTEPTKMAQIGVDLFNMFLTVGIITTIIFILVVICKYPLSY